MGLNISLYRIINLDRDEEGYLKNQERVEGVWDSCRYSGDKESAEGIEWEFVCDHESGRFSDTIYRRPKDFNQARKWVIENVFEGNRKRWLDIFDLMEEDKTLYFYYGY